MDLVVEKLFFTFATLCKCFCDIKIMYISKRQSLTKCIDRKTAKYSLKYFESKGFSTAPEGDKLSTSK